MPLFSVYHHDNEPALFSSDCTAGALNTALMDVAAHAPLTSLGTGSPPLEQQPSPSVPRPNSGASKASSKNRRVSALANLAAALLDGNTLNLNSGSEEISPSHQSATSASSKKEERDIPSHVYARSAPIPLYNYHKMELLPLSFVTELVSSQKLIAALQASAASHREQHPSSADGTTGHGKNAGTAMAAPSASDPRASTPPHPNLLSVLHNIPFAGLMTMPVHSSVTDICPGGTSYVLLGCREKRSGSPKQREHSPGGQETGNAGAPLIPGHDNAAAAGAAAELNAYTVEQLKAKGFTVFPVGKYGGYRFSRADGGNKPPQRSSKKVKPASGALTIRSEDVEGGMGFQFDETASVFTTASRRRGNAAPVAVLAPSAPGSWEVLALVEQARAAAARTMQRVPLLDQVNHISVQNIISGVDGSCAAPGGRSSSNAKKEKSKHSAPVAEEIIPYFGPRRLLTKEVVPETVKICDGSNGELEDTFNTTQIGSAGSPRTSRGGHRGKSKLQQMSPRRSAPGSPDHENSLTPNKDESSRCAVEDYPEIPLSGAASALLFNCPNNISISMNSGTISVRSAPADEESTFASLLASGPDEGISVSASTLNTLSNTSGKGGPTLSVNSGSGAMGATTHILERMEAFDVLWRGNSGEHEILSWVLQEYLKTMKAKIAAAYKQSSNTGGGADGVVTEEKRRKNTKKR